MSTQKVDLVVYEDGERKVIGEAVVDTNGEYMDITAQITVKQYQELLKDPCGSISVDASNAHEAVYIPPAMRTALRGPQKFPTVRGRIYKNPSDGV